MREKRDVFQLTRRVTAREVLFPRDRGIASGKPRVKEARVKEIPLTNGLTAQVDDRDYEPLMCLAPWYAVKCSGKWYAARRINARRGLMRLYMHQAILGSCCVRGVVVDHVDGNGLNNQRTNIRRATPAQNSANKRKQQNGGTSRFKGVSTLKSRPGLFRAVVKGRYLGFFSTEEEAARAYDNAALQEFGPFAALNFPIEIQKHAGTPPEN